MIVLTEFPVSPAPTALDPAVNRELQATAAIAKLLGFSVYPISPNPEAAAIGAEAVDEAIETRPGMDLHRPLWLQPPWAAIAAQSLAHVPAYSRPVPTVWLGKVPSPERYAAFYQAARHKNLCLLNTPEQHLRAQEFDRSYPHLVGLTPESIGVDSLEHCAIAAQRLGFPLVVRRARRDRWQPARPQDAQPNRRQVGVAHTLAELEAIACEFLSMPPARPEQPHSQGVGGDRLLLRQWVKLRHARTTAEGFPIGREFYVILHGQRVITYGYCWEGEDDQRYLSTPEEEELFAVALEAAARLQVPFVAIALGQREDGHWTVINTRDPQFGSLGQLPLIQFWHEMAADW